MSFCNRYQVGRQALLERQRLTERPGFGPGKLFGLCTANEVQADLVSIVRGQGRRDFQL